MTSGRCCEKQGTLVHVRAEARKSWYFWLSQPGSCTRGPQKYQAANKPDQCDFQQPTYRTVVFGLRPTCLLQLFLGRHHGRANNATGFLAAVAGCSAPATEEGNEQWSRHAGSSLGVLRCNREPVFSKDRYSAYSCEYVRAHMKLYST